MPVTRLYLVGSALPALALLEKLGLVPPPARPQPAPRTFWFHDTYDFRLWANGFLLRSEGLSWELVSLEQPFEAGVAFSSAHPPRFWSDFRTADLRLFLKPVLGVRALLPVVRVLCDETEGAGGGGSGETPLRLRLTDFRPETTGKNQHLVRVLALESERAPHNAADIFSSLGITPLEDFRFPSAMILGAGGRIPGEYARRFSVPLTAEQTLEDATRFTLARLTAALCAAREGIEWDIDTEFLHDFRVAVRRLRSWLDIVGPSLDEEGVRPAREAARLLGKATNELRDYDVLLLRLEGLKGKICAELQDSIRVFLGHLRSLRDKARRTMVGFFASGQWDEALNAFGLFNASIDRLVKKEETGPIRVSALTEAYLGAAYAEFVRKVRKADKRKAGADLHRLRLTVKKLRYGFEALSGGLPEAGIGPLLSAARKVQDGLGLANDCAVGRRLLSALADGFRGAPERIVRLARVNGAFLQLLSREEAKAGKRAVKALPKLARLAGKKRLIARFSSPPSPGPHEKVTPP